MEIEVRKAGTYNDVTIEHESIKISLGLFNRIESLKLIETLLDAAYELSPAHESLENKIYSALGIFREAV